MGGTFEGGRLAAETNKKRYGKDFYERIGAAGGKKSRTGGFYQNKELARRAGSIGGQVSTRSETKRSQAKINEIKTRAGL